MCMYVVNEWMWHLIFLRSQYRPWHAYIINTTSELLVSSTCVNMKANHMRPKFNYIHITIRMWFSTSQTKIFKYLVKEKKTNEIQSPFQSFRVKQRKSQRSILFKPLIASFVLWFLFVMQAIICNNYCHKWL